jgi:hypothetical protein
MTRSSFLIAPYLKDISNHALSEIDEGAYHRGAHSLILLKVRAVPPLWLVHEEA